MSDNKPYINEYQKRCSSILDSLNKITNKKNHGLNYDPGSIFKESNKNYDFNKFSDKETKSFNFADKYFNFQKYLEEEIEEEIKNDEKLSRRLLDNTKEKENNNHQINGNENINVNINTDFNKPIFNEKVKQNIIRKSEEKLSKKEKIDYTLYNKAEDEQVNNFDDGDFEMNKNEIFKKYKNDNLFFNEIYSKDNIMDICDLIGKEIEKNNSTFRSMKDDLGGFIKERNIEVIEKNINCNNEAENTLTYSNLNKIRQNINNDVEMKLESSNSNFKKAKKIMNKKKMEE